MTLIFRNSGAISYKPAIDHDGKEVTIVRRLKESEYDPEVGPMFLVRGVESGEEFHVYGDEIDGTTWTSAPEQEA